ncbi:MAG: terpene cyclase/mutase family protein [Planctomycetota bacterium]|nr:terpene cyclase/mutase family protein [Planctomycetota bacterium]
MGDASLLGMVTNGKSSVLRPAQILLAMLFIGFTGQQVAAQDPMIRFGAKVPHDAKLVYQRGLRFLVDSQLKDGSWGDGEGRQPGVIGLCVMAFLAVGEDPNYGRYSGTIRRAVRKMILMQDPKTGFFPSSMYHHGFATLALSEVYGTLDESLLWDGSEPTGRTRGVGQALELGVRAALTSQKSNSRGAWRYSPNARDADTSVAGSVLMGLLAARNAGIEIPDTSIDKAITFYKSCTSSSGIVGYSGGLDGFGESMNRSAIATLVFAVSKQKELPQYKSTLAHIASRLTHEESSFPFYNRYYVAQALFQGDFDAWTKWNRETIRKLKATQLANGSFPSGHGAAYGTSMSLLALALNYRFLPIYER